MTAQSMTYDKTSFLLSDRPIILLIALEQEANQCDQQGIVFTQTM